MKSAPTTTRRTSRASSTISPSRGKLIARASLSYPDRSPPMVPLVSGLPPPGFGETAASPARLHQQRLHGAPDPAALVVEDRLGDGRPVGPYAGLGVEPDPGADGIALEVHGEVGVEEGPGVPVED